MNKKILFLKSNHQNVTDHRCKRKQYQIIFNIMYCIETVNMYGSFSLAIGRVRTPQAGYIKQLVYNLGT